MSGIQVVAVALLALAAGAAAQSTSTNPADVLNQPQTLPGELPSSGVMTLPAQVPGNCRPGDICRRAVQVCEMDARYSADCTCPETEPAPSDKLCRPATGPCDAEEYCDGISYDCSPDYRQEIGDICRPARGDCDVPEGCDGKSITCPAQDKLKPLGSACNTVVRNGTNECPLLSTCDGFGPVCKGTQYCGCQPGWMASTNPAESTCFDKFKFSTGAKQKCTLANGWVLAPRANYNNYRVDVFVGSRCTAGVKVGTGSVACRSDGAFVISLRRLESARTIFSRMRAYISCGPPPGCSFNELAYTSLNQRDVTIRAGVVKNTNNKCLCPNNMTPYIMLYSDVATVCNTVPVSAIPLGK